MGMRGAAAMAVIGAGWLVAQEAAPAPVAKAAANYVIAAGTKVPLNLINSISTKHSAEGDQVYLETAFPILANGKIVIPVGSYVQGTVTQLKKPGRVKGRGELFVRFDSLTLPNGTTRDFLARIGGMDGTNTGDLDRKEGKITAPADKKGDLQTIGETTSAGAAAGGVIGGVGLGHPVMGLGIGAAAGAAAGMIGVLLSRGPDAILDKGTTVEMVLDRPLSFTEEELSFGNYQPPRAAPASTPAASVPPPHNRFPF
jgi:hypothetical protein